MAISEGLMGLLQKNFKENVKVTKVSPDLRGKVIVIYGGNNLGKTNQTAKFKNPIFLPVEKGLNATNGAIALKTTNWNDLVRNGSKLAGKEFVDFLKTGEQVTVIIDGYERIGTYCQNFLCSKYGVDDIGDTNDGFGCWKEYETLIWNWVDKLISLGYTVVFVGHEEEIKIKGKGTGKYDMIGDKRTVKPIRDNADIVCYLRSNGIDEEGRVIPSSAYLAETEEFFARCRFPYVPTEIEEFSAENFEKAVVEGIKYQNELEGASNDTTFEEQQEIYAKEEVDFKDVVATIKDMAKELNDKGLVDSYYGVVDQFLGEGANISEATQKNLEALIAIRDNLQEILDEE